MPLRRPYYYLPSHIAVRPERRPTSGWGSTPALVLVVIVMAAAAAAVSLWLDRRSGDEVDAGPPADLAMTAPDGASSTEPPAMTTTTTPTTTRSRPTTTIVPPAVELGHPGRPFVELPKADEATAIQTETGVVMRVIDERSDHWLVSTPCENIDFVSSGRPIGRAHVVLDPGHGGREVGASGATGITEKDLNLRVAARTAARLEAAGATVVLTRTGDHAITAASRGHIAAAVHPALFVSIHHNGGAPVTGDRPGTIVFTKTGSEESRRFGGLFHERLRTMLDEVAAVKRLDHQVYTEALEAHEALVAAFDQAMAAREAALVANGQLPPPAATVPPTTAAPPAGEARLPSMRQLQPTTTLPATASTTVPVPAEPTPPPPFLLQPVRPFRWAGSGNAGVRSWTRADGKDYLAVLRHSGDVPAVLAEFLYVTNPSEEELLIDPAFLDREAEVLADTIIEYFSTDATGSGFVADQFDDQPIGGSGGIDDCVEPALELGPD